ncbi:hypothetical protein VTN00DRAFT_7786 [Thermoascus crustaceus]|uniref:uncharacterized protein n=1 Tax=Thermoascus crustaceus TaxID=5088 RepID=UPI003743AE73
MPLTILTGTQLRSLLLSLSRDEILGLQHNLSEALREYSTGNQDQGCSSTYQPRRTAITRKDGSTTIFMPASTGNTMGIKIISLQDGGKAGAATEEESSVRGKEEGKVTLPIGSFLKPSDSSVESSAASATSDRSRRLSSVSSQDNSNTPYVSVNEQTVPPGLSDTLGAWPGPGARDTSPRGTVTLLDSSSIPFALINAQELTAFRTALAATMLFSKREHVRTVTVFGAGKQAYWHIRLALLLRGSEIKHVYIINRSFDRVAGLLKDIYAPENAEWRSNVKFSAVSSDFVEYERLLKESVRKADAIFCCTPATEPLFPADYLTSTEGRKKGRFVSAIGSYKPHMTELHPDILRDEVGMLHHHHHHHHKHAKRGGVVVVDSLDSCLKEAGEIIQAELKPQQLVEVGELIMVREASRLAIEQGGEGEKGLREWLECGNVIYKSVGLGLMDIVTGGDLVQLARDRGVGTTVEDF